MEKVVRMNGVARLPGNTRCPKANCNLMLVEHPMDEEIPSAYVFCDGTRVQVVKYGPAAKADAVGERIQRPR